MSACGLYRPRMPRIIKKKQKGILIEARAKLALPLTTGKICSAVTDHRFVSVRKVE